MAKFRGHIKIHIIRHGTLNLFAALNVATRAIKTKTTKYKKREDFIEYMEEVVKEYEEDHEIHVILDNYSTHKKTRNGWLNIAMCIFTLHLHWQVG